MVSFYGRKGRFHEAINRLQGALGSKNDSYAKFFLALSLHGRKSPGDPLMAAALLADVARDAACYFAEQALLMTIDTMIAHEQWNEARELVNDACYKADPSLVRPVLIGMIDLANGNAEESINWATVAMKSWNANVEPTLTLRLAYVLAKSGQYAIAAHSGECVRYPMEFPMPTICLRARGPLGATMSCSGHVAGCARSKLRLSILGGLRSTSFRNMTSEEAIQLLEDHVETFPDDRNAYLALAVSWLRVGTV